MDVFSIEHIPPWAYDLGYIALAFFAGLLAAHIAVRAALWIGHKKTSRLDNLIINNLRRPLYFIMPLSFLYAATWYFSPGYFSNPVFTGVGKIIFVSLLAWFLIRIIQTLSGFIERHYDITIKDNLRARQVHTRIHVSRRIAVFFIVLLSFISLFLLFDNLRGIGVSLIASAGVAGLIIGFAAQKTLGNLLAGVQIAITQPIRIDDVVIVEGEWGWIEEITLTYVVVRIWDLRRLIVPISYFIEQPFQNWTRKNARILGTVYFYTDYTFPVGALRKKVAELLEPKKGDLWDGDVNVVQVTDCKPDVMEVRVLISAYDSPKAWGLRCYLREEVLNFIQAEYPGSLPKTRATLQRDKQKPAQA